MQIAALLTGVALLAVVLLGLTPFVTVVGGGSGFDLLWPYLAGVILLCASAASALVCHARRHPDAWIHRSPWPRVIALLLVAGIAAMLSRGVLE